jgi:AcrR family transcriptional regulator
MSSRSESDLTTKARIRDAAIERFPRDGFAGATVRDIAADAGVSPGLVIHYFGSKANLHRECDEYVIHVIGEAKRPAITDGSYRQGGAIAALYQLMEPVGRYLAWALRTGGDASQRIFDEMLEDVIVQMKEYQDAGLMATVDDLRTQAVVLMVMQLGGLVLHEHYTRHLGVDTLSAEGMLTVAPHMLRIYSGGLFNPQMLAEAGAGVAEATKQESEKETQ